MLRSGLRFAAHRVRDGWGPASPAAVARLDAVYAEHHERTLRAFEQPLPELPSDGTRPDLLVGLGHYSHRSRDQYRAALGKALGVPPSAVRLSVAWRGRFDTDRLKGATRVLGVTVATRSSDAEAAGDGGSAGDDGAPEWSPLVKRERIAELSARIAEQRTMSLVQLHIVRAALPAATAAPTPEDATVRAAAEELEQLAGTSTVVVLHDARHAAMVEEWRRMLYRFQIRPEVVDLDATPHFPAAVVDAVTALREDEQPLPAATAAEFREEAVVRALSRLSKGNGELPCFFVHGRYMGSDRQLVELHKRAPKLRALLHHPETLTAVKSD